MTSVDLRGILAPLHGIHFISSHGSEQLPADSEYHDQVPPGCRPAKQLPSPLSFDGARGNDYVFAARGLLDFERCDSVAHDMTHVGVVLIEALDLVQHDFSIYDQCIYSIRPESSGDRCGHGPVGWHGHRDGYALQATFSRRPNLPALAGSRLASSITCASTFGSFFAIFDPVERIRVPSLSARANPHGVPPR